MAKKEGRLLKKVVFVLALASLTAVGLLGVNWLNGLVCRAVRVSGNVEAKTAEVIAAARVDTGVVLFDIEPAMIADRVQRLPWVEAATVTRMPPGTLLIDVEERSPVVLVIDNEGIPSFYLDESGYAMPVTEHSTFDLPLITGVKVPANPNQSVESRAVRELGGAIARMPAETDRLISSFVVSADGQISLRSIPVHGQGSITVRLGRRDFDEKLERLHAFWHQAVLTRPDRRYAFLDLRFDSQIVTRETTES